jgi:hypothetical protein
MRRSRPAQNGSRTARRNSLPTGLFGTSFIEMHALRHLDSSKNLVIFADF